MTELRLASTSRTEDASYQALADSARAAGGDPGWRILGGHMVNLHAALAGVQLPGNPRRRPGGRSPRHPRRRPAWTASFPRLRQPAQREPLREGHRHHGRRHDRPARTLLHVLTRSDPGRRPHRGGRDTRDRGQDIRLRQPPSAARRRRSAPVARGRLSHQRPVAFGADLPGSERGPHQAFRLTRPRPSQCRIRHGHPNPNARTRPSTRHEYRLTFGPLTAGRRS